MAKINLIRRIFVRQSAEYDCGMACIKMLFSYFGLPLSVAATEEYQQGMLSLADLKSICLTNSVSARAVEMEMAFLETSTHPAILHVTTSHGEEHFVVCFGAIKQANKFKFLIADPATQVGYLDEDKLAEIWVSRAALYVDIGTPNVAAQYASGWRLLWRFGGVPIGLMFAFSGLTLIGAAFGVGMSWLLQRGMNDTRLVQGRVMIAVLLLLLIIYIGRGLANYIKQYLLIKINLRLNEALIRKLLNRLFMAGSNSSHGTVNVKNGLLDIQKIQAAASGFIAGLCSDGTLIAAMIGAVFYLLPLIGLIDLITLLIAGTLIWRFSNVHAGKNAYLKYSSNATESSLSREDQKNIAAHDDAIAKHATNFNKTMRQAEQVGTGLARITLLLEVLQTINLALVFFVGFWQFNKSAISYNELMIAVIISYLISALIPRILNALIVLSEGVDAAVQFNRTLGA